MENDPLLTTEIVVEAKGLAELNQPFSEQVDSIDGVKAALVDFRRKVLEAAEVRLDPERKCTGDAPNLNVTFHFSPPTPPTS